ncbi:S4 domain-containing protein, partial [Eudoraea sp.]|uniref:S4 domain-containing protein n=1 Tax=Eudoraea sp. TaxID=1979955 RepID=UPI003C78D066
MGTFKKNNDKKSSSKDRRYKDSKSFAKGPKKISPQKTKPQVSDPDLIRLNRYVANSGVCSRRDADTYIAAGNVTVNGKTITEMGHKVKRSD